MKKLLLVSTLFLSAFAFSQAPTIQWKKTMGGTGNDFNRCITQTADGGFITVGGTLSTNGDITGSHGSFDYWVVKTDAAGTIQWQKALGGTGYDFAYSVKQTMDGGYVVVGWSDSNDGDVTGNHGAHDFWVVKLFKNGTIDWQKTYGGSNNDAAYSVAQTFYDGGYIVAGYTSSTDGDVVGNHGVDDSWVLKLDGAGNIQWKKALGGTSNDYARQIYQTSDQAFVVIGDSESNDGDVSGNSGQADCWVVKLDISGTIQWQKSLGGTKIDIGLSIQQASDNGYIVAGWSDSLALGNGAADYWLMKLDPSGNITWQAPFGGTGTDFAYSVDITADGGFVVSGNSSSTNGDVTGNQGLHDFWIIKFNGLPLAVNMPVLNQSLSIYPNPSTGQFNFTNIKPADKIEIYDITGRIIINEVTQTSNFIGRFNVCKIKLSSTRIRIYTK